LEEVFKPLEEVFKPLEEVFEPLEEVSQSLEEISRSLEAVFGARKEGPRLGELPPGPEKGGGKGMKAHAMAIPGRL
jgi:hypothetical protein